MTLQQGIQVSQAAKAKGYVTRAHKGKVQFIVGKFDKKGIFKIELEVTGWVGYKEAMALIAE